MDYKAMKKEELVAFCQKNEAMIEAGKTLIHLPKAIEAKDKEINALKEAKDKEINSLKEAKDKEINVLKEAKNQLIEKKDVALKELEERLAEKYQTEYLEIKTRTDAELKKIKDALAESQNKLYELDKMRIEQLNEVLYAYGDLLKIMQGTVDTHLKLNTLVVEKIGGSK